MFINYKTSLSAFNNMKRIFSLHSFRSLANHQFYFIKSEHYYPTYNRPVTKTSSYQYSIPDNHICVPIHLMMSSALLIKYGNTTIRAMFHRYFKTLIPYNLSSFSILSKALSSFCKSNFSLSTFLAL